MGNTINKRLKEIKANIESAFTTVTNNTFINEIKNQINTLTTNTTNSNANITKMIVEASFSNLPPKIGYLDETTVPINANFNMSYNEVSGLAWWAIGDLEGRENLYFRGSPSGGQGRAIYRCSRSSLSAGSVFTFENEPITVPSAGITLDNIYGLDNYYMFAHAQNGKYYRVAINNTSNTKKWSAVEITTLVNNCSGFCNCLYFPTVDKYLVLCNRSNQIYLTVCSGNQSVEWEDMIVNINGMKYSDPAQKDYTTSNGVYDTGMCYIEDKNILLVCIHAQLYVWNAEKVQVQHNVQGGYTDWLNFYPKSLLTKNYFTRTKWNMGAAFYNDLNNSNGYCGTGKYALTRHWSNHTVTYDTVNHKLYYQWVGRDETVNRIYRVSEDKLDMVCKGAGILTNNCEMAQEIMSPDTSPWSKRNYCPSVIYDNVYLYAESKSYGFRETAIIPEASSTSGIYNVSAGSWTINNSDVNWNLPNGQYCCVREDFNSVDGCSVYALRSDGTNLIVSRIAHQEIKDKKGINRDYALYNSGVVKTFKVPNTLTDMWNFPRCVCWAYHSNSFDGKARLIVFGNSHADRIINKVSGGWAIKNTKQMLTGYVINEDGSYMTVSLPQAIQNMFKQHANDIYPWIDLCDLSRNSFLDNDGRSFYLSFHRCWQEGGYDYRAYRFRFNTAFTAIEDWEELAGSVGGWNGYETLSWSKKYGYVRTYADRINACVRYAPTMKDAIQGTNSTTMTFPNGGSVGLITYVQSFPIFLGGYFSIVPEQEIYLYANKTNYIYLARDLNDYRKVNVEVYDKLLGTENKSNGINFQRILVTKIVCDDKGPISQEYYHIQYYGQ